MLRYFQRFVTIEQNARCLRCERSFDEGEVAVELRAETVGSELVADRLLHPKCALDVSATDMKALLSADSIGFAEREELAAVAQVRVRAIRKYKAALGARSPESLSVGIEPARDPLGRPRVRVALFAANYWLVNSSTGLPLLLSKTHQWMRGTVRSSTHEYVFTSTVTHHSNDSFDPSQPGVGAVIVLTGETPIQTPVLDSLVLAQLGPPVLWIVNSSANSLTVDGILADAREQIERAGLRGDECPSLVSTTIEDDDAMTRLAALLDEHLPQLRWNPNSEDAPLRAAQLLTAQAAKRHHTTTLVCLRQALSVLERASEQEQLRYADSACAVLDLEPASAVALQLLTAVRCPLPSLPLLNALQRLLQPVSGQLDRSLETVTELLVRSGHGALAHAVIEREASAPNRAPKNRRVLSLLAQKCV